MKKEQRKHRRFMMKEDEVFLFHDGNIGKVNNLSMGGCSCKCLVTENTFNNPTKLSILYPNNGGKLMLENVPFAIVNTCLNNILPFTTTRMKNCGLKFENISSLQKKQIELLILQCGMT